jgi:FkbH-like protein
MATSEIDFFALVREEKRLPRATEGQAFRLAVLGDASTQNLVKLLRVLLARGGVRAEIWEAGFDTIETEAFNPESELYRFKPEAVVILSSLGAFRHRYYTSEDKRSFAGQTAERLTSVWDAIRQRVSGPIVQAGVVLPLERLYGHYDHKVPQSLHGSAAELNARLARASAERPGVFFADVDHVAGVIGKAAFLDERLWTLAKQPSSLEHMPALAKALVDILLASLGRQVKCVVLDLDNTLWGGVIGDDGLEGIRIGHVGDGEAFENFQLFLRELGRRGILLAVCSKNTAEVAIRAFREHPGMILREEHIAAFVANWDDKATNIRLIRERLNIGFDSMVFLDDNPFERNLVRELLPEVIVPELPEDPSEYVAAISRLNLFETSSHSALDGQRAELYRVEAQREAEKQRLGSPEAYLKSLDMKIKIARFDRFNLPRIAQLLQRSNQFNLMTRRLSQADCERVMLDEQGHEPFYVCLGDRFGDHGLISVVVLREERPRLVVDEYVMSCRVLQRGVEEHVMNRIFEIARDRSLDSVSGAYRPTAKNAMVKDFFSLFGFLKTSDGADGTTWALDVADYAPRATHITDT